MKKSKYDQICGCYARTDSIKATAKEFEIDMGQVRKCLLTSGAYESVTSRAIHALQKYGVPKAMICEELAISKSAYCNNTPYTRFEPEEPTINALRIRDCRKRKEEKNEQNQTKET